MQRTPRRVSVLDSERLLSAAAALELAGYQLDARRVRALGVRFAVAYRFSNQLGTPLNICLADVADVYRSRLALDADDVVEREALCRLARRMLLAIDAALEARPQWIVTAAGLDALTDGSPDVLEGEDAEQLALLPASAGSFPNPSSYKMYCSDLDGTVAFIPPDRPHATRDRATHAAELRCMRPLELEQLPGFQNGRGLDAAAWVPVDDHGGADIVVGPATPDLERLSDAIQGWRRERSSPDATGGEL